MDTTGTKKCIEKVHFYTIFGVIITFKMSFQITN